MIQKKKVSEKMKARFKEGETVYDPYIDKKIRYKHERDKYSAFRFKKINK